MEQFSKFLASRLARQQHTATTHPDADALAAFIENRVKPNERNPLLAHLASCADCREVLSLISPHATPTPSIARSSFQWWNLRWAGALVAACLIAMIVLRRPAPDPPLDVAISRPNTTVTAPMPAAPPMNNPVPSPQRKKFVPPHLVVLAKPAAAPSVAPTPPLELAPQIELNPQAEAFQQRTLDLAPPPPLRTTQQLPTSAASAALEMMPRRSLAKTASLALKARTVWRIGNNPGTLTSSDDSGLTWRTIPIAGQTNLFALSVSGWDVWAGGENGALFHSTDNGLHWHPVTVPFTDAITAIHTNGTIIRLTTKSADWFSSDGGHTWSTK